MSREETRWVARLTPMPSTDIDVLLEANWGRTTVTRSSSSGPGGNTRKPIADRGERESLSRLARRLQELIRAVHGQTYTPEQSSELYPTAGDTTDWTYGVYGIPSFTVELRPYSQADGGFILPPAQIQPTWEKNRAAALQFVKQVL